MGSEGKKKRRKGKGVNSTLSTRGSSSLNPAPVGSSTLETSGPPTPASGGQGPDAALANAGNNFALTPSGGGGDIDVRSNGSGSNRGGSDYGDQSERFDNSHPSWNTPSSTVSAESTPNDGTMNSDNEPSKSSAGATLGASTTATNSKKKSHASDAAAAAKPPEADLPLVLTGDRRRGLFECDYCRSDISQVPRIRCAVCPDFDLCLDCFSTTDPSAASSTRAAANAAAAAAKMEENTMPASTTEGSDALTPSGTSSSVLGDMDASLGEAGRAGNDNVATSNDASSRQSYPSVSGANTLSGVSGGNSKTHGVGTRMSSAAAAAAAANRNVNSGPVPGLSAASVNHDSTHGYRVADSTRFPLFPSLRGVTSKKKKKRRSHWRRSDGTKSQANEQNGDDVAEWKSEKKDSQQKTNDGPNNSAALDDNNTETKAGASSSNQSLDNAAAPTTTAKSDDKAPTKTEVPLENDEPVPMELVVTDDPRHVWTCEEDLRLLDAVATYGVGNWADVADAVSGFATSDSGATAGAGAGASGSGVSTVHGGGKTARRCMERYYDDFLGRYGHILPPYTLVRINTEDVDDNNNVDPEKGGEATTTVAVSEASLMPLTEPVAVANDDVRSVASDSDATAATPPPPSSLSRKRKRKDRRSNHNSTPPPIPTTAKNAPATAVPPFASLHHPSAAAKIAAAARRTYKYKVVPTSSLPGYDDIWPFREDDRAYVPALPGAEVGDEVGRDLAFRAEVAFVKETNAASTKANALKVQNEWQSKSKKYREELARGREKQTDGGGGEKNEEAVEDGPAKKVENVTKLSGPAAAAAASANPELFAKVLPPRLEDIRNLPGSELAGYMPRRGDFDVEWDNEAEKILADMEFSPNDLPQDRELKLRIIEIYNSRLDERERRKQFLIDRNLLDYRENEAKEAMLPPDERDLVSRMRLFARFHKSATEHNAFVERLLKAKRLRKEIAMLQLYRRMGIRTLAEAERYELDKTRREHHRLAVQQKEADEKKKAESLGPSKENSSDLEDADSSTRQKNDTDNDNDGDEKGSLSGSGLWKQYRSRDKRRGHTSRRGSASDDDDNDGGDKASGSVTDNEEEEKKMDVGSPDARSSQDNTTSKKQFDISRYPGYALLSSEESQLCGRLQLLPQHYLEVKKALIAESLSEGLLDENEEDCDGESKDTEEHEFGEDDEEGSRRKRLRNQRYLFKIDIEKRDDVIDFIVRAGWIATRPLTSRMKEYRAQHSGRNNNMANGERSQGANTNNVDDKDIAMITVGSGVKDL